MLNKIIIMNIYIKKKNKKKNKNKNKNKLLKY